MSHYHAVVWMDHNEARIFQFNATDVEKTVEHAASGKGHVHHHAGSGGSNKSGADKDYLNRVAADLEPAGEILVVGPGQAKLEFLRHVHKHNPQLEKKILSVETVDHPTDGQLLAYARKYFKKADKMLPI